MSKLVQALAIIAVLGFPVSVIGFRLGIWQFGTSFSLLAATGVLAGLVFLVSLLLSLVKRNDPEVARAARSACIISLVPLLLLGSQARTAKSVPEIHNISTDTDNPPQFEKIAELRGKDSNPLAYDIEKLAEVQKAAYPNVKPLPLSISVDEATAKAKQVIIDSGWELVSERPGLLEATETTLLWGFKDDVVVRITQAGDNSIVDVRSVSRIGRSDLGKNAARIEGFLKALSQ